MPEPKGPNYQSFLDRLAAVCRLQPDLIALQATDGRSLSYGELAEALPRYAAGLRRLGVRPGARVAIAYGRSCDFVLALLACWQAGAVWTPIAGLPPEREAALLTAAEPVCILGSEAGQICLEALSHQPGLPAQPLAACDPAYLIFTSGSTGRPKGVLVPHTGIVPMLEAQIGLFALSPATRSLWLLSPLFDASISDIGTALLSGATLVIDPEPLQSLDYLYALLVNEQITYIDLPPSLLAALDPGRIPASLSTLVIGGEVADQAQIERWASRLRLINVYGPTEATVCTSANPCRADQSSSGLIGQPLPGVCYRLDGEPPAPGARGELWIASPGLALGYWQQPELTAERFIRKNEMRWYRSGDKVEFTADGDYRFLGRLDRQFKQQGRLLCPEEVEAALLAQPGIRRTVVLRHASGALAACLQGEATSSDAELAQALSQRLPAWMIPSLWLWPQAWPLTPSGKPDLAALASLPLPRATGAQNQAEPGEEAGLSAAEGLLAGIWEKLLKQPVADSGADFFALGGSSVQVLACVALAAEAGLRLSPESFYRERSLGRILATSQTQAMSWAALRACLPAALPAEAAPLPARPPSATGGKLLLTGATGFLGSRLLAGLLQQSRQPIVCLVRAESQAHGRQRVHQALAPWLSERDIEELDTRLEILCGDLARPDLGLEPARLTSLFQSLSSVLHCAAQVDLVRDFESLAGANLAATARLAALCREHSLPLHHVSTLSVFVAQSPKPARADEAALLAALSPSTAIHGGYAQSKFAADAWLQAQSIAPWIYRPGLVTGDSRSGHGPARDWLGGLIRGLVELGTVPESDARTESLRVDITPVDYAAAGIIALMSAPADAYHLANPVSLSLSALLEALQAWSRRQGHALEVLPAREFRARAQTRLQQSPGLASSAALLALCAALEPQGEAAAWHSLNLFQATDIQLASPKTLAQLESIGIVCPLPDSALLETYFRRSLDSHDRLESASPFLCQASQVAQASHA